MTRDLKVMRKLSFTALQLQQHFSIRDTSFDARKANAVHFLAASIENAEALKRILYSIQDLTPETYEHIKGQDISTMKIGDTSIIAVRAIQEITNQTMHAHTLDVGGKVILGLEVPSINGNKSIIYDIQNGEFHFEFLESWKIDAENRFMQEDPVIEHQTQRLRTSNALR